MFICYMICGWLECTSMGPLLEPSHASHVISVGYLIAFVEYITSPYHDIPHTPMPMPSCMHLHNAWVRKLSAQSHSKEWNQARRCFRIQFSGIIQA